MHTPAAVNPDEFRRALTPQVILSFQLVEGAILMGVLYDRQFQTGKGDFSASAGTASPPAEGAMQWLSLVRKATILRLALIESPAIFGLTIYLIAAINGVLHDHPGYWGNRLSALILLLFIIATFPNSNRLTAVFDEKSWAL